MARLVLAAVPRPGVGLLTYRVPEGLPVPARGGRVLVPLGPRVVTACVVDTSEDAAARALGDTPSTRVRDVLDTLDLEPLLPPEVLDLALWVADYYLCAPGEAVAAAMPPRAWVESDRRLRLTASGEEARDRVGGVSGEVLRVLPRRSWLDTGELVRRLVARRGGTRRKRGHVSGLYAALGELERAGWIESERVLKGRPQAFRTVAVAALTAEGHAFVQTATQESAEAPSGPRTRRLGPKQQAALDRLRGTRDGVSMSELQAAGIARETIARLVARGLVRVRRVRVDRDPFEAEAATAPDLYQAIERTLTAEQDEVLTRLDARLALGTFHAVLLHGVTGSGKTEIYRRLALRARDTGRRALILVPEIALTPAVAAVFRETFGTRVAVLHSGLSDGERHDEWHRVRRGEVDVVVGTRSAVFAPLDRLGLVVVDEEHDGSYKQEDAPRYHGRDVAVVRAQRAGALAVLGSATPSMESYQNALDGRYERLVLERRVLDRPLASVRIVDMRQEYAARGPEVILSEAMVQAIEARLARGEQSLVLLNRRGYATAVFCRQCGATLECPYCSVSLVVHRAEGSARCHYCNHGIRLPRRCLQCGGLYLELVGVGTERVERELRERFPGARIARLDRDTVRRRGALVVLLRRVAHREVDILVGTQLIAKGHDFPNVTFVGVVSADVGLGLPDFRAAERTFQLLTQVAGRAGRGDVPGEAVVQTLYPDHYTIRHACRQDYQAFFEQEIRFRRAMRYPPAVALINVVVRARTAGAAMTDAATLVQHLRRETPPFRVLGPAPAALARLRGEARAQFFIKGTARRAMREALAAALEAHPSVQRRTVVDVDPMSVL